VIITGGSKHYCCWFWGGIRNIRHFLFSMTINNHVVLLMWPRWFCDGWRFRHADFRILWAYHLRGAHIVLKWLVVEWCGWCLPPFNEYLHPGGWRCLSWDGEALNDAGVTQQTSIISMHANFTPLLALN
jgi:hypothetical protein